MVTGRCDIKPWHECPSAASWKPAGQKQWTYVSFTQPCLHCRPSRSHSFNSASRHVNASLTKTPH